MNFYLKVARRLFVVLVVMICGGWYSDSRGDDVYVKHFGEITELNTAIARDGDPAGLLVNESSEKYKGKALKKKGQGSRLRDIGRGKGIKDAGPGVICDWKNILCIGLTTDNPCPASTFAVTNAYECKDSDGRLLTTKDYTYCCPKGEGKKKKGNE
mgnify:CR=1 FL=1